MRCSAIDILGGALIGMGGVRQVNSMFVRRHSPGAFQTRRCATF
jgi:hypothetical protein